MTQDNQAAGDQAPPPTGRTRRPGLGLGLRLLLYGPAIYLGLTLYLYLDQDHLLYLPDYPGREIKATPDRLGLEYRTVSLTTADGVRLHGWFLPQEQPRATLLFFHGNAGNISHRLASLQLFHELGLAVLIIDYRGYGRSGGKPGEAGIYRDADAAWNYLTRQRGIPPGRILLMGRSFGAAVAAYTASRHRALGLVLESTFSSVPELAASHYPGFPVRWLSRSSYDTQGRLPDIRMPLLVIHSPEDELIPFAQGEALFRAARPPKRLLTLSGGHNAGWLQNIQRYHRGLDDFIDFCLSRQPR